MDPHKICGFSPVKNCHWNIARDGTEAIDGFGSNFFKKRFYLILERGGREGKREGEKL